MSDRKSGKRRRIIAPGVAEPAPGLWSNCFAIDNLLVIAGMVGRSKDGEIQALGDPYRQSVLAFERMKAFVEAGGGTMSDIIKLNCYLTDIRHRDAFIKARKEFFSDDFPPCVVIGNVTFADSRFLVEVEALAIIGSGD
jgi:2-iminobutanoate/2-iminopropanoate deaminase